MENIATGGKHGDPTYHHKWQDNRKSGRKSKQFCEIWQVTGIYIKWHEKINVQKKYDVHQKEYQVQQNMVNVSEKEEVE